MVEAERLLRWDGPQTACFRQAAENYRKRVRQVSQQASGVRVVEGRVHLKESASAVWISEDGTVHIDWPNLGPGPQLFSHGGREFVAVRRQGNVLEIYELAR